MTRATLLALADRVEALSGPDREVMCEAFRAVFPEVSAGSWDAIDKWDAQYDQFCGMLDAGAHLDAAMTLVPERAWVRLDRWPRDFCAPVATVMPVIQESGNPTYTSTGSTLPLALVAAALRARAEMEG